MSDAQAVHKKVFVGLSGGVDSSVSAALLKEQGYDVTGVFIKVWQPDFVECTWQEDRRDAMRVCAALDIPFETLDLEDVYKHEVVDYMIAEYAAGRTPNPDVMCNRHVKFGAFLGYARSRGAEYVATGHYAQNIFNKNAGKFELWAGKDAEKDQSYFLWTLTQQDLQSILFPVGHLQKHEVRALAARFGLPTAAKKDSQGLCFLGKIDMQDFLSHFIKPEQGVVLDTAGREIGHHNGALLYTLGQRHGFMITDPVAPGPYYVVRKDLRANTVTVASNAEPVRGESSGTIRLTSTNWISGSPDATVTYGSRIRYRQALLPCRIQLESEASQATARFETRPVAVPGQSLVAYHSSEQGLLCIGGGVIA